MVGLLCEGAMIFGMVRAGVEWWVIVVSFLVVFGVILVLATVVASARTAPVKVMAADRSRGVVRLRFRNSRYLQLVAPLIDGER